MHDYSTIQEAISGSILANEVRLGRAVHCGSFFLVEGAEDSKLFSKFIELNSCSIIICHGKDNLLEALNILEEDSFSGALGFADKDFSDYIGFSKCGENIVYTDDTCVEVMILMSDALVNTVRELGDVNKVKLEEQTSGQKLHDILFDEAAILGALRILSLQRDWNFKFKDMKYKFVDKRDWKIDLPRMIAYLLSRSSGVKLPPQAEIEELAQSLKDDNSPAKKICQGHDCVRLLGRAIRKRLGSDGKFDSPEGSVQLGRILRLSYEYAFFQSTDAYRKIRDWERMSGYTVLKT